MYTEDDIFNYTNFNTIEQRILTLNSSISSRGYTIDTYTPKTWSSSDFLFYTYLNNIETGIENLGTAYTKPTGWQNTKTWEKGMSFSYRDVNRWITDLNLIEQSLNTQFPSN